MKPNKSILFFGSQITTGGAQRVLLDQAAWFHQQGYRVKALFYYDKDGKLPQWQEQYPFPIDTLSVYKDGAGLRNLSGLLGGLLKLDKHIREFKPDAIECFTHDANLIGIPIAWLCGVPVRIATHHGRFAGLSSLRTKLHTWVINSELTSRIVCVSGRAKTQALAEGIREEKIQVIFNGITPVANDLALRKQTRAQLGLSDQTSMILNVGRLVPEKAQRLLIDAAQNVIKSGTDAHFFIAGDGPLRSELEKQIRAFDLDDRLTLLGNRSDIPALLNAADLFVLYSETEGMPISLMEAMSAGVAVIASDLEGIAEIISTPDMGTLIPFGDSSLLSRTILAELQNSPQTSQSALNGRQRIIRHFSLNESCETYKGLFFPSP